MLDNHIPEDWRKPDRIRTRLGRLLGNLARASGVLPVSPHDQISDIERVGSNNPLVFNGETGGFAIVTFGKRRSSGELVAIKTYRQSVNDSTVRKYCQVTLSFLRPPTVT